MMRVLVAEDDLTSRTMLEGVLRKWGYAPVVTSDGKAAWEELQKPDAPNLAVIDWNMPGMNGLEICHRIREMNLSNPPYIIILTANGEKGDIVKGLEAGANDYISKPYDNEELQARIRVGQRMIDLLADLHEAKNTLAHEAMHDPLTGAFNRRAILEGLTKELSRAKRKGTTLSIGLCDIDHFKMVNDRYGHQVGDEVLCNLVCTIQNNLRDYDLVGRYGGEEFLVVAPGSLECKKDRLYERLCERVASNEIVTNKGRIAITISIGVMGGTGGSTVETMLAAADAALYQAKENGRNCLAYADQGIEEDQST